MDRFIGLELDYIFRHSRDLKSSMDRFIAERVGCDQPMVARI